MTYNGWANYETWNVALWIDNDEGLYLEKCRFLRTADDEGLTPDSVESFCRDLFPEGTPDMDGPAAMALVDWEELADAWREELD